MEFLPFDTAMQISTDRRTRLLEQAGHERRPRAVRRRRRPSSGPPPDDTTAA